MSTLHVKLNIIKKVFNIGDALSVRADKNYIRKYYKVNKIPYSLFHSNSDLIHMGITRDGKYKESDLLEPAKTVEGYIKDLMAKKVLELATGRGANSVYLARKLPDVEFYGLDISEGQLAFAFKKAKGVENYFPAVGDYHDLSSFAAESLDVVFIIEALCYSVEKEKVLAEVKRVLRKGGVFIVFDGYFTKEVDKMASDERIACILTGKGMAIDGLETYEDFKNKALGMGFDIAFEEDVSLYVLPTMERFEKIAKAFFGCIPLAKVISWVFPHEFSYNAISGYLMPSLIKLGLATYRVTVLRKPA